ncbi:hypothetical protein [Paenibacillus sp. PCH8]|uniref:hypothetical protein n=1 Tax=Paenibacillus sp. PCH8 TaxID=2066524 RepID=UPI0015E29437|nr:hypothetical protein [Paenibacillus sp. PCH8]
MENKEILEMLVEDVGLTIQIEYVQDAQKFLDRLEREKSGFKTFDMFFIDYSLSYGILGSSLIKKLRGINVDSDILFYSSQHESDIREMVSKDLGSFEGVYIANRNNFDEKSNYLIKKNSKRLSSLSNIRGLLTDQTSQNDFIVNSYVMNEYPKLTSEQQVEIMNIILDLMKKQKEAFAEASEIEIMKIETKGSIDIKKLFKLRNFLFTLDMKYKMFQKIIEYNNVSTFDDNPFENYKDVTQWRNKLAHKKLEVCKGQRHIIFSDNHKQHTNRMCSDDCIVIETDLNEKISIDEWNILRKKVVSYGKCFDSVLDSITPIDIPELI